MFGTNSITKNRIANFCRYNFFVERKCQQERKHAEKREKKQMREFVEAPKKVYKQHCGIIGSHHLDDCSPRQSPNMITMGYRWQESRKANFGCLSGMRQLTAPISFYAITMQIEAAWNRTFRKNNRVHTICLDSVGEPQNGVIINRTIGGGFSVTPKTLIPHRVSKAHGERERVSPTPEKNSLMRTLIHSN